MPQPYGQEAKKKNVHVHKDFKVKNIPYVNRTFSTTSTPSKTPKITKPPKMKSFNAIFLKLSH